MPSCTGDVDNGTAVQPRELTDDDLVISRAPDNHHELVWAPAEFYDNGEGVGPVVFAEITPDRVAVRATGTLRAMVRRARLHFQMIGDHKLLVAEGDRCRLPTDPTTCSRSVRLMEQHGDHFVPIMVTHANGTCIAPARFDLTRQTTVPLDARTSRTFELATTLTYGDDGVTIHESVVVKDADTTDAAVPPRVFRRVDSDRVLQVQDDRLVTERASLWSRMMDEHASVATQSGRRGTPVTGAANGRTVRRRRTSAGRAARAIGTGRREQRYHFCAPRGFIRPSDARSGMR